MVQLTAANPTTQNINSLVPEPQMSDLLDFHKKLIKLEVNCHHVAKINSFNPTNQTATATINYTKTFLDFNNVGTTTVTTQSYPVLLDCPVFFLGGGQGSLTFPVSSGDECLAMFNDRDMDNWFSGSSNSAPATTRLHSFTDAILLVGIRSLANSLKNFEMSATTLTFGTNTFKIYSDKAVITLGTSGVNLTINSSGQFGVTDTAGNDLLTTIQTLLEDIQNATVNTMFGPQPLIMPTFVADLAKFQAFII